MLTDTQRKLLAYLNKNRRAFTQQELEQEFSNDPNIANALLALRTMGEIDSEKRATDNLWVFWIKRMN